MTETARPTQLVRQDGSPIRALIVDDEASLADLLTMALRYEGWEVKSALLGHDALTLAREFRPDVIVLDIMLPDIDGLEVLPRLRQGGFDGPALFLTAKDSVRDRIAGLTVSGDDYVTKPFSLEELVARLRALLRRSALVRNAIEDPEVRVGDLVLNEERYEVTRNGTSIDLTATEFELLRYLMRNPHRVLSKAQILDHVWSYEFAGRSSIVELYISYLRKKIDVHGMPMIHTVRGVGYTIKATSS